MEEQILQIIKNHFYNINGTPEKSAKEITTHVKNFIKWINKNYYNDTVHVNGDPDKWTGKYKDSNIKENHLSTEQVYQCWLTKI